MHQPQYVDPRSGRAMLPWVRLHGARGYLDVAQLLWEHGDVRMTVNFVPSLVQQLQQVVDGAVDEWLHIAELDGWNPDERAFAVERFFSLNWDRSVRPRPRYAELLAQRERKEPFSDPDVRDLTVLFNLGWLGFAARAGMTREIDELEQKARNFSRADLALVDRSPAPRLRARAAALSRAGRARTGRAVGVAVLSPDRAAGHRHGDGATSVADGDAAAALRLSRRRRRADRARRHRPRARLRGAAARHVAPRGQRLARGGRRLRPRRRRLARHRRGQPVALAVAHGRRARPRRPLPRLAPRGASTSCSAIASSPTRSASPTRTATPRPASPTWWRARARPARSRRRHRASRRIVPIFLDGENPWESYPGFGEPFLRTLFSALSSDPELSTASIGHHLDAAPARRSLTRLHSGSWIDSAFHIWIADPVKNRAWELLGRARARFDRAVAEGATREQQEAAFERLLAAEGSDWFWWFGEPFHSMEDALFDALFRAHLAGAYAALGLPVPRELGEPVAAARPLAPTAAVTAPWGFIRPQIGGNRFYDWQGAGRYLVPRGAAMADTPLVAAVLFGFDNKALYLRLEPADGRAPELAAARVEVDVAIGQRHLLLSSTTNGLTIDGVAGGASAHGRTVELTAPWSSLGVRPGERLLMIVRLFSGDVPLARYPADGALELTVPGDGFEAENWSA